MYWADRQYGSHGSLGTAVDAQQMVSLGRWVGYNFHHHHCRIIIIISISGQAVSANRQSIIGVGDSLSTFSNTVSCRVTMLYCCWIFRMYLYCCILFLLQCYQIAPKTVRIYEGQYFYTHEIAKRNCEG
jgi:hypothetical protein